MTTLTQKISKKMNSQSSEFNSTKVHYLKNLQTMQDIKEYPSVSNQYVIRKRWNENGEHSHFIKSVKSSLKLALHAFVLIFFVNQLVVAQGSWSWRNPYPQGNHLNTVHAFDADNAIFLGNHGTTAKLYTGNAVYVNNLSEFQDIKDVKFVNPVSGYAVGGSGSVYKTTDAGVNWYKMENFPINVSPYAVDFINEDIGWVVGASGKVFKTADAGNSWNEQFPGQSKLLKSIDMINDQLGWIVGEEGLVLKTVNGGSSWSVVSFGITNTLNDVFFLDADNGFIVGDSGKLYRTDNGSTFTILSMGSSSYTGFSIFFLNYDLGWITTPSHILRTTNAGNNWTAVPSGQSSNQWVRDVKFVDELNGWACTDGGGISKTTDGGVNWYNLFYNTSAEVLYDIQHINDDIYFAIGSSGAVLKSTNGLYNFTEISRVPLSVLSFDFIDENTGWAVGYNGKIAKTTDGGVNWVEQQSNLNSSILLWNVQFIDSQIGFAVGTNGNFLRTTNGGDDWTVLVISSQTLTGLSFIDANNGWVSGQTGALLKTTDGGVNWTGLTTGSTNNLYNITFLNENVGYAASIGIVYKTIDGGANWTTQRPQGASTLWNIDFINENVGWTVGASGMIFYTENGGDTWEIQQSFTDHFIYGLDAVSIEKAVIGTPYSGIIDYYRFIPDVVSMSLSSDKEELFVGDTLTVEVRIGDLNEAEDVIGASLELSWDSDALQYIEDSAEIGDFFSENPLFFATKKDGERVLDLSSGSGLSQGKNGSGSLARMKFKAINNANVSLNIQNSRAEKKSGEFLDVEESGLVVSIASLSVPVITSFDIQATEVGGLFKINGENFGTTQVEGSSIVRVGDTFESGVNLEVDTWTDTQITIYIPNDVTPGSYTVFVQVETRVAASPSSFTIESAKILTNFANLGDFVTSAGSPSAAQAFTISGNRLTNDVTISVNQTDFEISKTKDGTFSNQLVYSKSGDVLIESQVWIRISASAVEGLAEAVFVLFSENAVSRAYYIAGNVNPAGSPVISSLTPKIGTVGTEVTISGSNFGSTQNGSEIKIGLNASSTLTLTPLSWSDSEIKVILPELSIVGDYAFYITVNSIEAVSTDKFSYVSSFSPFISTVTPSQVQTEETITIAGVNFGTIQASSKVWIGANINSRSEITSQSWSETEVTVIIPNFFSTGFYSVWLEISGTLVESPQQIQIVKTDPVNDNTITLNGVNGKTGTPVTGNRPFIEFDAVPGAQDYKITMQSNSGSSFAITSETSFRYPTALNYGETYTIIITPRFLLDSGSEPIDGPSVSIEFSVFSYASTVNNSVSYSPSGNLAAADYRLLGISGAATSISSLISIPAEEYKVYRWSGSSYSEYYSNSVPGEGYWVIATQAFQVSSAPASVTLDENNAYTIPVKADWNIITNPFETAIGWNDELSGGQMLYDWEGNWVPTTLLQPSKAYAWKNTTGKSELVLNYYDLIVNQGSAKRSAINDNQVAKKQTITLSAQGNEEFGTRSVQLAIYPENQNQYLEKLDTELPPQPFEMSQLALIDDSNETSRFIRRALTSNESGYSIPLTFELLEDQNLQLYVDLTHELKEVGLINLATGRYYSLTQDPLQLNLAKGIHKFQFVAGESSFINEQQAALMPKDFTLIQNYPNPFNPSTQIAFSLPIASTVKLEVFDLLGRRVALLADGMLNAGYHTRSFDGSNLSSGMYLYRIQAGEFVQVKKMMLLK